MEMQQVRYAVAAAEFLNFTRAAANCSVSQPALTKGIKALEAELGAQLFLREGRRVHLSDFGRAMLPRLQMIAAEATAARNLARDYNGLQDSPLRLGVLNTIGHIRFSRFLRTFHDMHGSVDLSISEGAVADLVAQLHAGDLEACVVVDMPQLSQDVALIPLYTERYVVILPPGHSLARHDAIKLSDLDGERYVDRQACELRENLLTACAKEDVHLDIHFRSEREDWTQTMVIAGMGFALMPEYSVSTPGLIQRPLIHPRIERKVSLATLDDRATTPALEALLRLARGFNWPG